MFSVMLFINADDLYTSCIQVVIMNIPQTFQIFLVPFTTYLEKFLEMR